MPVGFNSGTENECLAMLGLFSSYKFSRSASLSLSLSLCVCVSHAHPHSRCCMHIVTFRKKWLQSNKQVRPFAQNSSNPISGHGGLVFDNRVDCNPTKFTSFLGKQQDEVDSFIKAWRPFGMCRGHGIELIWAKLVPTVYSVSNTQHHPFAIVFLLLTTSKITSTTTKTSEVTTITVPPEEIGRIDTNRLDG